MHVLTDLTQFAARRVDEHLAIAGCLWQAHVPTTLTVFPNGKAHTHVEAADALTDGLFSKVHVEQIALEDLEVLCVEVDGT